MILDHVFVLPRGLDPARPLARSTLEAADAFSARLAEAGFVPGSARSHPGQGTANRRLFLDDLMIECLRVDDEAALDHPRGAPLALGPRFRSPRASGIGFGFRPDGDAPGADRAPDFAPDFAAIAYRPAYLPEGLHIDVAEGDPDAPLVFHLPFAGRGRGPAPDGEPRRHPNGANRTASLRLASRAPVPEPIRAPLERAGVRCEAGAPAECLHVRLAGVRAGFELDLRPPFPLRLHA